MNKILEWDLHGPEWDGDDDDDEIAYFSVRWKTRSL